MPFFTISQRTTRMGVFCSLYTSCCCKAVGSSVRLCHHNDESGNDGEGDGAGDGSSTGSGNGDGNGDDDDDDAMMMMMMMLMMMMMMMLMLMMSKNEYQRRGEIFLIRFGKRTTWHSRKTLALRSQNALSRAAHLFWP